MHIIRLAIIILRREHKRDYSEVNQILLIEYHQSYNVTDASRGFQWFISKFS